MGKEAFRRKVQLDPDRLRAAIERNGLNDLTQRVLAERIGVTDRTLRKWLKSDGPVATNWSYLETVADGLGVAPEELIVGYTEAGEPDIQEALRALEAFPRDDKNAIIRSFFALIRKQWLHLHVGGSIDDPERPFRVTFGDKASRRFRHEYGRYVLEGAPAACTVKIAYELRLGPLRVWADIGELKVDHDLVEYDTYWWTDQTRQVPRSGARIPVLLWIDPLPERFMVRSDVDGLAVVEQPSPLTRAQGDALVQGSEEVGFEPTVLHERG